MITDAHVGYETRLHIGYAAKLDQTENWYFSEIATFDLCKVSSGDLPMGNLITLVRNASKSDTFSMISVKNEIGDNSESFIKLLSDSFKKTKIYIRGSVDEVEEDCYGDRLVLVPADVVLCALKESAEKSSYRRLPPAIALLESIMKKFSEDIYCILYGY